MLTQKINFKKMSKELTDTRVKKLQLLASTIEEGIASRTLSGKDMFLKDFDKYSKLYKAYRKKEGLSNKVNLFVSGEMLGGITSQKITDGLKFKFSSKSASNKASWNNKTRKFFGTDRKQRAYLRKKLSKL